MQAYGSPDYIGIGFRRCASTWLHECLYEHPEIGHFRGKSAWGAHFFSHEENYRKGVQWYEQQLQPYTNQKIVGELSDSYTYPEFYEQAAARIHQHYPQVKLLCIVRNPIDRAYSDYHRSVSICEVDQKISFEKAIELDPHFIERGFYGRILREYEDYLSDDRLLVLFQDDLKTNPGQFVKQIYTFLGVGPDYVPSILGKNKGHASMPRSQNVQRVIDRTQTILSFVFRRTGLGFVLDKVKSLGLQRAILNLNRADILPMQPTTRTMLYDLYHDHINELATLLNKDLSFWEESDDLTSKMSW